MICKRACVCVCVCVGVALLVEVPSAHGIIRGFTPSDHDRRFDAVGALMRTENWQTGGVGGLQWNNTFCNGTLIAPNVVMLSQHCLEGLAPDTALSFRFRRKPDGSVGHATSTPGQAGDYGAGTFYHVTVDHFILAPHGIPIPVFGGIYDPDFAMAVLSQPVTHIDPIPVRYISAGELPLASPIFVAGWGVEEPPGWTPNQSCPTDSGPASQKLKVADTLTWPFALPTDVFSIQWQHVCFPATFPPCECGPANHDSGGAVLVESQACLGRFELVATVTQTIAGFHFGPLEGNPDFPIPPPCPADLNNSSVIDALDLGILLSSWSIPATAAGCGGAVPCRSDLNCDGLVNSIDLGFLIAAWGPCVGSLGFDGPQPSGPEMAAPASGEDDEFYQWLIQATLEDLFEWFDSAFALPLPASE